jgi:hypothetical protein
MKKYLFLLGAAGAVIIAFAFTSNTKDAEGDKVTICHYPPGNPANVQEITISQNAWSAHESHHGDFIKESCEPCPCLSDGGEN